MTQRIFFARSKKRIGSLLGSIKPLKPPLRSERAFQNVRFAFCVLVVLSWPRFGLVFGLVAEILSWDVNQNPIDLLQKHTKTCMNMRSHCVLNQKVTFLRCTCYTLNAFCNKRDILPKHTWIMHLHGVLILKHIILLIIFHRWNHWGDLRPHGVLHIWDDSFFYFYFRAAFTMGEKIGVTFPSSWGA